MARDDRFDPSVRLDRFAELLSLDIPMNDIAERLGMSRSGAHRMLKKLRDKYGRQAQ